jgi:hypothetical protein
VPAFTLFLYADTRIWARTARIPLLPTRTARIPLLPTRTARILLLPTRAHAGCDTHCELGVDDGGDGLPQRQGPDGANPEACHVFGLPARREDEGGDRRADGRLAAPCARLLIGSGVELRQQLLRVDSHVAAQDHEQWLVVRKEENRLGDARLVSAQHICRINRSSSSLG